MPVNDDGSRGRPPGIPGTPTGEGFDGGEGSDGFTLGQRIRRLRQRRGLSLARVAGEDFSRAFLNQIEMGRSRPSIRVLRIIAERLEAPVQYLVQGPGDVDRLIALERARLALAAGQPEAALALLEETAAPPGHELEHSLCRLRALALAGRDAEADRCAEQLLPPARRDPLLRRRVREARQGLAPRLTARDHVRLAESALADGRPEGALAHLQAARAISESVRRRRPPTRRP